MNTTERATKEQIITAAIEAVDYHADRNRELSRQRNALAVATAILAVWVMI